MNIRDALQIGLRIDRSVVHNGCWKWTGQKSPQQYGRWATGGRHLMVHRLVYEALVGPIPEGLMLDHLCRNTLCVNPQHLEPVSNRTNILRGVGPTAKHAAQTHCWRGHALTPENITPSKEGWRRCRLCNTIKNRRWRQNREAAGRGNRA